jgi:hypothetical protein
MDSQGGFNVCFFPPIFPYKNIVSALVFTGRFGTHMPTAGSFGNLSQGLEDHQGSMVPFVSESLLPEEFWFNSYLH